MSAAPAHYYTELRRPKHIPIAELDLKAIAIAHHRYFHADSFCMNRDPDCENFDDSDLEYAREVQDVLALLPDWTPPLVE